MAQDYAKRHSTVSPQQTEWPGWSWFIIGFVFGLFVAFIIFLWKEVPADENSNIAKPTADVIADKKSEVINYDFFEMFPEHVVPIIEEYTPEGKKVVVKQNYSYALQTGSFRNPADANRLRAKLILMGLQVIIQQVEQQDSVWHRVLVGPIDTRLELDRTRNRLAQANIVSIQLRMSQ